MKKIGSIVILFLVFSLSTILNGEKKSYLVSKTDHSKFEVLNQDFKGPEDVTKACLSCHTKAAHDIMKTSHWTWSSKSNKIPGRKGKTVELGKKNALNNFCISIQSNEPRCTSCHIGYGWKDKHFDFTDESKVDCLICHDTTGTYKKFPSGAGYPVGGDFGILKGKNRLLFKGNGKNYFKPDYRKISQNIGKPGRDNCGVCHFYGGGGNDVKHGDLDKSLLNPTKHIDIHMAKEGANMQCVDCHIAENHDIKGQLYSVESENRNRISCERCHTEHPHTEKLFVEKFDKRYNKKLLNRKTPKTTFDHLLLDRHSKNIACQTCHIPYYSKTYKTKVFWDWSKAGKKITSGPDKGKPLILKDKEGHVVYNGMKGEFRLAKNITPEYYLFSGIAGHMMIDDKIDPKKQPIELNHMYGFCNMGNTKIWPMKVMRGKQPYDPINKTFIYPKLFGPKGSGAYWSDFDWKKSAKAGMKYAGKPFSGEVGFVETKMYWPLTHMVAPKEEALKCSECHSRNGRLKNLKSCWIPGRDRIGIIDTIGFLAIIFALFGVLIHGFLRIFFGKRFK